MKRAPSSVFLQACTGPLRRPFVTVTRPDKLRHRLPFQIPCDAQFPPINAAIRGRQSFQKTCEIWFVTAKQAETTAKVLFGASCTVFTLAYLEGLYRCQAGHLHARNYALAYARSHTFSSIIWDAKDPTMIARAAGLEPKGLLNVWVDGPAIEERDHHRRNLVASGYHTARSVAATVVLLSQAIGFMNLVMRKKRNYARDILDGTAPMLHGVRQRVIRLCGMDSDATRLALSRYGQHIVPIYESPETVRKVVERYYSNGNVPVYLRVQPHRYGSRAWWDHLTITPEWYIPTQTGQTMLLIEADTTEMDQALAIGRRPGDLSLKEACQGFRCIELKAKSNSSPPDFVTRVLLGDSFARMETGGRNSQTLRESIMTLHEVDVFIDAAVPVLQQLLEWAELVVQKVDCSLGDFDKPCIVFHTDNANYFSTLEELFLMHGIQIVDRVHRPNYGTQSNETYDSYKARLRELPRLVYMDTTDDTVMQVSALRKSEKTSDVEICAVTETAESLEDLYRITTKHGKAGSCQFICTAEIYENMFDQVREWLRTNFRPDDIQAILDKQHADLKRETTDAAYEMLRKVAADAPEDKEKPSSRD